MANALKSQLLYYATDKDLFDALISSRQQFSEESLRQLARTRGIYYSEQEDRITLCDKISLLIFGFHDVSAVQSEFERAGRGAKTASFRMKTALTLQEIKQITGEYIQSATQDGEQLSSHLLGDSGFALNLKYNELDFSKTSLRQLQPKEARIEVKVVGDYTVISYPHSEKALTLATAITKRVNTIRSAPVEIEEIDLSVLPNGNSKTSFFYRLATTLDNFKMVDVTNIKVDSHRGSASPTDDNDDENDADNNGAEEEMLGVVKAVALQGQSLFSSREYQSLQKRGFFISKIQWSARRSTTPYEVVEFDASFSDPLVGSGFTYSIRGWSTVRKSGEYTQNFNPIPADDKKKLLQTIEVSATRICKELKEEALALLHQDGSAGGADENSKSEAAT